MLFQIGEAITCWGAAEQSVYAILVKALGLTDENGRAVFRGVSLSRRLDILKKVEPTTHSILDIEACLSEMPQIPGPWFRERNHLAHGMAYTFPGAETFYLLDMETFEYLDEAGVSAALNRAQWLRRALERALAIGQQKPMRGILPQPGNPQFNSLDEEFFKKASKAQASS